MNRITVTLMSAAVGVAAIVAPAAAQDARTAEIILAEINALQTPEHDRSKRGDEDYQKGYMQERNAVETTRAALILELYQTNPDHEQIETLMPKRWSILARTLGDTDAVLAETERIMNTGDGPLAVEACYTYAQTIGRKTEYAEYEFMPALEHFVKMAPEDDRAASLLMSAARFCEDDTEREVMLYRRVLANYPDARAARYTKGKIRQIEGLNKPFKLEFNDAISGETVSMRNLRGKVVVIDFWATWCGPCVKEIPHMKELYAQYRDQGVEFIGVSLDKSEEDGGLDKLREYCDENDVNWPQYYQGDYWNSEFSTAWGINSIPAIFIIDRKGSLHSVNARGQLDDLIPELLGIEKPAKDKGGDG